MRRRVWITTLSVLTLLLPTTANLASATIGTTGRSSARATTRLTENPDFDWPLHPEPTVTRAFDPPVTVYGTGHRGADLAAEPGEQVLAASDGTVIYARPLAGRGVISIQHDNGLRTTYEPVTADVAMGDRVRAGEVIGKLGSGHPQCPREACLHWGVRAGAEYLDPLVLVRADVTVRLKPW